MPLDVPLHADPPEVEEQLWSGVCGRLAFDIGANVGQSYILFLKDRFDRTECFEPHPASFAELAQVHPDGCHNIAVSDFEGEVLLRDEPGNRGMYTQVEDGPAVKVPCSTLTDLSERFGRPDFLKIDVEGHELEVVRGGLDIIANCSFIIEVHKKVLGDAILKLFPECKVIRHPHYPESSALFDDHFWLKR